MWPGARLKIVDGRVFCPAAGEWESVDECAKCADVRSVDRGRDVGEVVCHPRVSDPYRALERILSA